MSKKAFQMTDKQGNDVFPICGESGDGWIRFADGTQICWGTFNVTGSPVSDGSLYKLLTSLTVRFAKQFTDRPSVHCSLDFVNNNGMVGLIQADSEMISRVDVFTTTGGSHTHKIDYIAIGRWR